MNATEFRRIGDCTLDEVAARLKSDGLGLRLGNCEFRIQSRLKRIAQAVHVLHADRPLRASAEFCQFRLQFDPGVVSAKPVVVGTVNGIVWQTFPRRLTVAAMEWISSWCFFRGVPGKLAVHAAAAAMPDGSDAIIFPGVSGAGKSTLASTLMMTGWQLLSDEIALIDLGNLQLTALGRPTILKGESLDLMRQRYGNAAVFGPLGKIHDPPTRIAHLRPTANTVEIAGQTFDPKAIVFPNRSPQADVRLEPATAGEAFTRLGQLGINYRSLGASGFQVALALAQHVPAFQLHYDDAENAEALMRNYGWPEPSSADAAVSIAPAWSANHPQKRCDTSAEQPTSDLNPPSHRHVISKPLSLGRKNNEHTSTLQTLIEGIFDVEKLADLSVRQWDRLIPIANNTQLLPRIAFSLASSESWHRIPDAARFTLEHENQRTQFNHQCIDFELKQIASIVDAMNTEVVLLKGAAYLHAKLPWAAGRRTSDVDLLVSEQSLAKAESALMQAGYRINDDLTEADCRYYRRWLHEIQPIRHHYRDVEVDLHFRLLPQWDKRTFATDAMIERSTPIQDSVFRILDPVDRVLHGVLNLARIGEYRRAFRDLYDIISMTNEDGFDWDELWSRAQELKLTGSLACILRLGSDLMEFDLPTHIRRQSIHRSNRISRRLLLRMMKTASIPDGPTLTSRRRRLALWAMEHYPFPKLRTWLDPLTWTKRAQFHKDD